MPCGTEADEPLWTRKEGHERARENVEIILKLEKEEVLKRNAQGWKVEGKQRRVKRKEGERLRD